MSGPRPLSAKLRRPGRTASDRDRELSELGFIREPGTRWLDPGLLARSAVQSAVSSAFGRFADKRETQASREQEVFTDLAGRDELWLDFLADTGDGWPATMTMAWLLAQPAIDVGDRGAPEELPRGDVLLLGGDLVYPAADRVAYEHRFVGPFAGALPTADPAPHLFAIPGNHDWYDGLTSFLRRFCQPGWIGGWQTCQRRSYCALQLPHGWWVWMIDIQLDERVDDEQLRWFAGVACGFAPGDRIVLVTGKPSWLKASPLHPFPPAWENLALVERSIRDAGGEVAAVLTGDLHHYARYEPVDGAGPQRITAGGGGAYLSPTHTLPDTIELRATRGSDAVVHGRAARYPAPERSRAHARGILQLAALSPAFGLLVGAVYALLAATMLSALAREDAGLAATAHAGGLADFVTALPNGMGVVLAGGLIAALWAQIDAPGVWRWPLAVLHGAAHVATAGLVVYVMTAVVFSADAPGLPVALAATLAALAAGFAFGTTLLAGVLWGVSAQWGGDAPEATNQVFAAQGIEGDKNWLRMHIGRDGSLTIHVLGVDEICRAWTGPHPDPRGPRFMPAGEAPRVRRIDVVPPLRRRRLRGARNEANVERVSP